MYLHESHVYVAWTGKTNNDFEEKFRYITTLSSDK